MKIWKFISIALISCGSSMLLAFISRRIVDLALPIFILKLLALAVLGWLLFDNDEREVKAIAGTIGGSLITGLILGYWDEFGVFYKYQLLPIVQYILIGLVSAVIVALIIRALYAEIKNKARSN